MSNGRDGKTFSNISATTAAFTLDGGQYGIYVLAAFGGGNVTLQGLAPDGATWVAVLPAFSAAGYGSLYLSPGQYRFLVTTATAVTASISGSK